MGGLLIRDGIPSAVIEPFAFVVDLQTCFAQGITLRSFDHNEPTLHDVFVELVGDDAREAQKR